MWQLLQLAHCATSTGFIDIDPVRRRCPACGTTLSHQDDAVRVQLDPPEQFKSTVLSGLDPMTIMECASRAVGFWNYQAAQQAIYQESLIHALRARYAELNHAMDEVVKQGNTEIERLTNKNNDSVNVNTQLQKKISEMAVKDRERAQTFSKMRRAYEALKRREQARQQHSVTAETVEQIADAMTTGTRNDGHQPVHVDSPYHTPRVTGVLHSAHKSLPETRDVEQLNRHQRAGSGSQPATAVGGMLPPPLPFSRNVISPMHINTSTSRRTLLPTTMRTTADRSNMQVVNSPYQTQNPGFNGSVLRPGIDSIRQILPTRTSSARNYGGLTSGMKFGKPDQQGFTYSGQTNSNSNHGQEYRHRHTSSLPQTGALY